MVLLGVLVLVLGILFYKSFQSSQIVFANDGPLGALATRCNQLPSTVLANWHDTNWLGTDYPSVVPNFTGILRIILSPVYFSKFYAPLCLLVLGISAWLFFRQLGFHRLVCISGGLAASLNGNALSNMCWGQGSRPLALAAAFLALAAICSARQKFSWIKIFLCGFAVGWGVSEGFDIGALFSIYVAIFVVFLAFTAEGSVKNKVVKAGCQTILVAVFAALISAQTVGTLVGTQLKGTTVQGEQMSKEEHFNFLTQWSTPKLETIGVFIPGVFGYATTTPDHRVYWGRVGQTPGVPQSRFNGSGEYAGVLVFLFALGAVVSLRKREAFFSDESRKVVWFWAIASLVSLVLAYGKYAPFYQLVAPLPFFSSMRNPMKFMHPFHLGLLILFGYGLQAFYQRYIEKPAVTGPSIMAHLKKWWAKAGGFERKWCFGLAFVSILSALGWLLYSSARKDLAEHLQKVGFDGQLGSMIAAFSIKEVGWFVLLLLLSSGIVTLILSGYFSGSRARTAGYLILGVLALDLVRANIPWVVHWDYQKKYATNPIIDILRHNPHLQRVAILPIQHPDLAMLGNLYHIEWKQHHNLYYNIQCLDIIQEPRPLPEDQAYRKALTGSAAALLREWELTNTRYILSLGGGFVDALNQQFDPIERRFRLHTAFDIAPKPGASSNGGVRLDDLTAVPNPNGKFALVEFTGALPRVKLYSRWQINTNPESVLQELQKPEFDPQNVVIVDDASIPASTATTNQHAGTVEIINYSPKQIELEAKATTPSILLYNDKFSTGWQVWVDGKESKLVRANYLMRGLYLEPGNHTIKFKYRVSLTTFYVTTASIFTALILCGYLAVATRKEAKDSPSVPPAAAAA